MEPLNVPTDTLAQQALGLVGTQGLGGQVPDMAVPPAGSDPVTRAHLPGLNQQAATLANAVHGVTGEIVNLGRNVGAALPQYVAADSEGAQLISGGGGEQVANPVAGDTYTPQFVVAPELNLPELPTDPQAIAEQFLSGPGPAGARQLADGVRNFVNAPLVDTLNGLEGASGQLRSWTPVGTLAAEQLDGFRTTLGHLGKGLNDFANTLETYAGAYELAKGKHPTPEQFEQARQDVLAAMKSKDPAAVAAAMENYRALEEQSKAAVTEQETTTQEAEAEALKSLEEALTSLSQTAPQTMNTLTSGANQLGSNLTGLAGNGLGGNPFNPTDPNQLSGLETPTSDPTSGLGEYDSPSGVVPGGGGPSGSGPATRSSGSPRYSMGSSKTPMATTANAGTTSGNAVSKGSVVPAVSTGSSGGSGMMGGRMMPFMPMGMGGMGGAGGGAGGGGNERNRVTAWHPDQLIWTDDTQHVEQVIGERPAIAPTTTPPAPTPAMNQPTQQAERSV